MTLFTRRMATVVLGSALIAAGAPVCADGAQAVTIHDFTFEPARLEITAGTRVVFTNTDRAPHTATGAKGFDTGRLASGASAAVTFNTPGTYAYVCRYHPHMKGEIVVK